MAQYYSIRQLNPYRGVVQIIAVGSIQALSVDGHYWHARNQSIAGRYCSVGGISTEENRLIDFAECEALLITSHNRHDRKRTTGPTYPPSQLQHMSLQIKLKRIARAIAWDRFVTFSLA